jgi:hypothetical protein
MSTSRSTRRNERWHRPSIKNSNTVTVIMIITTTSILLNVACLITGVNVMARRTAISSLVSNNPQLNRDHIACVTCEHRPEDQLQKALVKRLENNVQHCCAQDSDGMTALLELIMREPFIPQNGTASQRRVALSQDTGTTANFSLSLASAHNRLIPAEEFDSSAYSTPLFTNTTVSIKLLDNSNHTAPTDHSREVNITRDGFQIIHSGVYYVYTNARFKPDSSEPCRMFRFKTWNQEVTRQSGVTGERTTIMKSVHTCPDDQTMDRESSFTGGTFKLETGDLLELNSSGSGLISFFPYDSYFGLFLLDGGPGARSVGQSGL